MNLIFLGFNLRVRRGKPRTGERHALLPKLLGGNPSGDDEQARALSIQIRCLHRVIMCEMQFFSLDINKLKFILFA